MTKQTMLVFLFVGVILLFACKFGPFFAPLEAKITISSDKIFLNPGGDKAVLTLLGFNKDGTAIRNYTRIILKTNIGILPPYTEMIDGQAVVDFISGSESGEAAIEAISGDIQATPNPLKIIIGHGGLAKLEAVAFPATLPIGGGASLVSVRAMDQNNRLLPDVPVNFLSDYGTFQSGNGPLYTNEEGKVTNLLSTTRTATVTVSSDSMQIEVKVEVKKGEKPSATFFFSPTNPKVDENIYFNAGGSSDPDGTIVRYQWDFGDGTRGNGKTVSHRYSSARTYKVVLEVTDNDGLTGTSNPLDVLVN